MSADDDIELKATKLYVGFLLRSHNLVDVKPQKGSIVLWMNTQHRSLNDPQHLITGVIPIDHHGNGDCQIKIFDRTHMGYIRDLIRAHYRGLTV